MQVKTRPRHFVRLAKIKEFVKTPGWQASGERVQADTISEEDNKAIFQNYKSTYSLNP